MEWAAAAAVAGVTAAAAATFGANKSDTLENLDLERYVKKLVSEDGLASAEHARDAIALGAQWQDLRHAFQIDGLTNI